MRINFFFQVLIIILAVTMIIPLSGFCGDFKGDKSSNKNDDTGVIFLLPRFDVDEDGIGRMKVGDTKLFPTEAGNLIIEFSDCEIRPLQVTFTCHLLNTGYKKTITIKKNDRQPINFLGLKIELHHLMQQHY